MPCTQKAGVGVWNIAFARLGFHAAMAWLLGASGLWGAAQPWQRPYAGADATGAVVLAFWRFEPGAETRDSAGGGQALVLRGASRPVGAGVFGGACLEGFATGEDRGKPNGALARNRAGLSPAGAFTIEMWIKPKPELESSGAVYLLDKKYIDYHKPGADADRDYCLKLVPAGEGRRRLTAQLGFGEDSADFGSSAFALPAGEWAHVAFAYDGAGVGRFFLNGRAAGASEHPGRGPVSPGKRDVVIGDRIGSNYGAFPGFIDEVRITAAVQAFRTGSIELDCGGGRRAFRRMEANARIGVRVINQSGAPLSGCEAVCAIGDGSAGGRLALGEIGLDETREAFVPMDTSLRPGRYPARVTVTGVAGGAEQRAETAFDVVIAARPVPGRMPVVLWGTGELPRVKEIGFTHQIGRLASFPAIWKAEKPEASLAGDGFDEAVRMLDDHLAQGIGVVAGLSPGHWVQEDKDLGPRFNRVGRDGKGGKKINLCGNFPEVRAFMRRVGESVGRTFGTHPAFESALVHTEIRDGTRLCFHPHDIDACRRDTGRDIPPEAAGRGVRYSAIRGFPADRLVPADDPILSYFRWFWKDGDGWNPLHTLVHEGLKSTGRKDLWTFFDPAVRVPPVWGSGGGVDVISQWTYSYPDPIKIGQACDELFAMAKGRPGQRVMKMTQIIWYRSQTAPELPADESKRTAWEREIPDARFITISPDHLREALWCELARPVQGIMYHGWGSLVPAEHRGYRFTNPETVKALASLIREVVEPLGAALLQVPDRPAEVGLLESFASQVFAGRGTSGWGRGWEADMHLVLQWAQMQPEVLYEETVMRDGLDGFRVLVLPGCDVLPRDVADRIVKWQRKGGIVVGDEFLTPAVCPDILLSSVARSGAPDKDKALLQARAAELRKELDPFYSRFAESDNPDVVVRCRRAGDADYVFAINDRREFGDYVGQHGKVMERGLPATAGITARRRGAVVYDLLAHREVKARAPGDAAVFQVALGPGEGRVFMIAPRRIGAVTVEAPAEVERKARLEVKVRVTDAAGSAVAAVVPVRIDILDPSGRPAEFSGHHAAVNGEARLAIDIAPNDAPGHWTIRAVELASGRSAEAGFVVKP